MNKFAKLNRPIMGRMTNSNMWIQIGESFYGEIVAEDRIFVTLRKDDVVVHVKRENITEIDMTKGHSLEVNK